MDPEIPEVGTIIEGYRFNGGDPSNQENWQAVSGPEAAGFTPLGGGWWRGPDGGSYQQGSSGAMVQRSTGDGAGPTADGASPGRLTEAQARATLYGGMMAGAERDYQAARSDGYDPASLRNQTAAVAGIIPFDGDFFGRLIRDDASDAGRQAELRWAEANLRQLTGAAATNPEIARVAAINFDRGNDTLAEQRYRTRSETYDGTRIVAGVGAETLPEYPGAGASGEPVAISPEQRAVLGASDEDPNPLIGFPTLPGFGGGDGTEPPGSENNPYDYDALDLNQRQALPLGTHIASRNEDGTYRLRQFVQAGFADRAPSGAVERDDGTFEVTRERGVGEAGAFASGAAEQIPFGDEVGRHIVGALTGDGYDAVTAFDQQQDEIDRQIFSGARDVGGVTGGATGLLLPGGSIMRGTRGLNAFARGAGIGAGYGAAYGAGAAEDGQRWAGARDGAIIGGLTGGLAEPVGAVVGRVGTAAGRTVDGWTGGRLGEGLNALTGGRVGGAQNGARDRMMEALRRDGYDGPQLQGLMDQWQANGGTDAALIDLVTQNGGGQNFMSLVRASALRGGGASGAAQQYRAGVEGGAADNAINLTRGLTPDQRSVPQAADDLRRVRSEAAEADYAGPYAVRGAAPRDVLEAMQGRAGTSALRRAYRAAEARQDAAQMQDLQAMLDWRPGQPSPQVSAGAVDRVRIAFGEAGESLNRDGGRDIAAGLFGRASQIDEVLGEIPDLAPARQRYRDNTQRIQGLELGQGAYSRSPGDLAAQLDAAPAARDTFGLGMARDIEGAIGRQGDGSTGLFNRLATAPNARNALAQGFGPERAQGYQNALAQVVDRVRTARAIDPGFGSQTAQRGMDALIEGVAPIAGGPVSFIMRKLNEGLALTDAEREIIVRYATSLPDSLNALAPRNRQRTLPRPLLGAQAGASTQ